MNPAAIVKSALDQKAIAKLEAKVDALEASYVDVGRALDGIRSLFYSAGQSWEEFSDHCNRVWEWTKTTVDDKIASAEIAVELLRNSGVMPRNMYIALAFRPLESPDRLKVWKQLISESRGKTITGADARIAVAQFRQKDPAGLVQIKGLKALKGMKAEDAKYVIEGIEKKTQDAAPPRVRGITDSRQIVHDIARALEKANTLNAKFDGDRDTAALCIELPVAFYDENYDRMRELIRAISKAIPKE